MPTRSEEPTAPDRRLYVGIDPGKSGGMALLFPDGSLLTHRLEKLGHYGVGDQLEYANRKWPRYTNQPPFVLLEQVGGFMGPNAGESGGNRASSHTMFALGREAGIVEGILIALRIEYVRKVPQAWQKLVAPSPRKPGETRTSWKNRLKEEAQRLFPDEKVVLATADAILLAVAAKKLKESEHETAGDGKGAAGKPGKVRPSPRS